QVAGLASAGLTLQRSDAGYVRRGHAGTGNAPVHLTALLRPGLVPGGEHTYSRGRDVHTAATDTGEAARREDADVEQVVQCCDGHDRGAVCRNTDEAEEHTSELQSLAYLVCRLLLEKKKKTKQTTHTNKQKKKAIKPRIIKQNT